MSDEVEIVLLGVAGSEIEAGMWKDELEQADIRTLVRPGGPGAGAWASSATFEHQVFVRADQLELAQEVLDGALDKPNSHPRKRQSVPTVNRARKIK